MWHHAWVYVYVSDGVPIVPRAGSILSYSEVNVFEDALRKLNELQRKAEQMNGQHSVPLGELFPEEFMLRQTDFSSIAGMIDASGFPVVTGDDFAAIPREVWDAFVKERTRFLSWEEMRATAMREWATRQLGLR
jgi:hypothetical protein